MNLAEAFPRDRPALMPFLMSGHPTPDAFASNLEAAAEFADVIEVGVPFSDPIADGPIIQAAATTALKQGTTLANTLDILSARRTEKPVVLMLSFNQILAAGLDNFARRAAHARVSGAIIPDLPFEESAEVREALTRHGLVLIPMLAPTTRESRSSMILEHAEGFIYLISVAGVTGARDTLSPEVIKIARELRTRASVPVCIGFGISKPEHIRALGDTVDGVIVGSALIHALDEGRKVSDVLALLQHALLTVAIRS